MVSITQTATLKENPNVYPKRKINDAKPSKTSLNTRVPIFPFISLHFHKEEKGENFGNRLKG